MSKKKSNYRPGVGAMLFNAQGQVLVAQRIDNPGPAWQMPQGGIDKDEDPEIAVMRELEEEIGTRNAEIIAETEDWLYYDIPDEISAKLWKGKYKGQRQMWYALRFMGNDQDIQLDAHSHPEFSTWKWVDLDSVPSLIVPFKRDLYQQIVEAFRPVAEEIKNVSEEIKSKQL